MTGLMLAAAAEEKTTREIYVAPPTIHDENLQDFQPYLNSLVVSAAQANKHWVKRSKRADYVTIHDKHTIEVIQDTTCNYNRPLKCSVENMHWLLVTDIFTTPKFATIVVKLYDENAELIASSSKSSYSIKECKEQITTTTISEQGAPTRKITQKKPDECTILNPDILSSDIERAITIMFASIHPSK